MQKKSSKVIFSSLLLGGLLSIAAPASFAQNTNASLFADLVSSEEVAESRRDRGKVGDTDGSGEIYLFPLPNDEFRICFSLNFSGIDHVSAGAEGYIYEGPRGRTGSVAAVLPALEADGQMAGCLYEGTRSQFPTGEFGLIQRMLDTPEKFYVNIHTAEFPDGAIRGQLVDLNKPAESPKGKGANGKGKKDSKRTKR